jgi:hypothetical protein
MLAADMEEKLKTKNGVPFGANYFAERHSVSGVGPAPVRFILRPIASNAVEIGRMVFSKPPRAWRKGFHRYTPPPCVTPRSTPNSSSKTARG